MVELKFPFMPITLVTLTHLVLRYGLGLTDKESATMFLMQHKHDKELAETLGAVFGITEAMTTKTRNEIERIEKMNNDEFCTFVKEADKCRTEQLEKYSQISLGAKRRIAENGWIEKNSQTRTENKNETTKRQSSQVEKLSDLKGNVIKATVAIKQDEDRQERDRLAAQRQKEEKELELSQYLKRIEMESQQRTGEKILCVKGKSVILFVPSMKSKEQNGFITMTNSENDNSLYSSYQAFNDNPPNNHGWLSKKGDYSNVFIGIKLPEAKVANFVTLQTHNATDFGYSPNNPCPGFK